MRQKVLVKVTGEQRIDGEIQKQEVTVPGEFYIQNGKRFVLYEEEIEGNRNNVRTLVKENEECIEVVKNGAIKVKMHFEMDKPSNSAYNTPMGNVALRMITQAIEKEEKEAGFMWKLFYTIYMDGQYIGENILGIDVAFTDETEEN